MSVTKSCLGRREAVLNHGSKSDRVVAIAQEDCFLRLDVPGPNVVEWEVSQEHITVRARD